MNQTTRLKVIDSKPRGFWRKRPEAPDTVLIGQNVLRVADACIEQLRFLPEDYQIKAWELVESVLKDSERQRRMYEDGE